MLLGGYNMPIKGTSLFASKPIVTPPPKSVESTGALASVPNIFGTETSGTVAFSGGGSSRGGGSTVAVA